MPIGMPTAPIAPIAPPPTTDVASATGTAGAGESFAAVLGRGLDSVQQSQSAADGLAVQAATGDLQDVHDYTIAATKAQLATELTVAIRNKAVESFSEIMRMPI
jgi:flagellar hook-basal body complex protein FliE